jgi:5-methylcytosine-specific restriction endonuclease McrA
MREYMLKRYHTRRAIALDSLGGVCKNCGSEEQLEFDHIDPTTKQGSIAKLWSYSYQRFLDELKLCQLLCRDCHIEKSKMDNGVEHGGGKSGKWVTNLEGKRKACACGPCRKARNLYMKKF